MSRFKIGDLVTPINAGDYEFRNARERLFGKVLMVTMVLPGEEGVNVRAGIVEGKEWYWFSDDLRLVSAVQPEPEADQAPEPTRPTKKPETMRENWGGIPFLNPFADAHAPEPTDPAPAQKPLRRGDLVEYDGRVCVVAEIDPEDSDCWVAALTGEHGYDRVHAKELTRIGSIRKKVKRLKAAIAKAGGES